MLKLALGASALALLTASSGVYAQEAEPATMGAALPSDADIVVTAQRRSERLQDVPISVSAISGEMTQNLGIRGIIDVQILTPGTSFTSGFGFAQLSIRGIGSNVVTPGLESPVAIYSEGVILQRSLGVAALFDTYDPGSIQVLRGPQGTLYGRNATGGAILINSADPTDKLEGRIAGELGNLDHRQLDAMLNLPVSDTLSLRVAGRYRNDDGHIRNRADGRRQGYNEIKAIRGKLRWQPTDALDVMLTAEYQKLHTGLDIEQLGDVGLSCLLCGPAGITTRPGFYEQDINSGKGARTRVFSTNLRIQIESGNHMITSTTGYRNDKLVEATDQDFTTIPAFDFRTNETGGKSYTQDFVVSSNFDTPFNYLMGLSYLNDKGVYDLSFAGSFFPPVAGENPRTRNTVKTESIAAFVEGSYNFTPELKATAGARYTYDKRQIIGVLNAGFGGYTFNQRFDFRSVTPRFVLAWDNGPINLYYSFTRGFKAGGFFTPAVAPVDALNPEKNQSHEIGLKSRALGGRLRTNLSLFYYKDKDLQTTFLDTTRASVAVNAGAQRGYGAELDAQFDAAKGLTIGTAISYLDAQYTRFPRATVKCLDPGPFADPTLTPLFNCTQDLRGVRPPFAPKWTLSFNASYDFTLGGWAANLSAVARYQSRVSYSIGSAGVRGRPVDLTGTGHMQGIPVGYDTQKGYTIVNTSGYVSPIENIRLGFYIDNLLDKKYATFRQASAPFGLAYSAARPRTYGVRASYQF